MPPRTQPEFGADAPATTLYVDAVKGSDSNSGTITNPLQTINHAVIVARPLPKPATIFLRAGVFYLPDTINLGPADAGLTIQNYVGEIAEVSGGQ